ncbi:MAG: YcxB family protein [Candidatus Heimdallarchaeota archaeon]|nr:YcxB family protein [Anaerolineae bacterium]MDH5646586.1 YcxB family protein [Candidatus Heimdallarchaeota archaeon]
MELVKLSGKYTFDDYNQSIKLLSKGPLWSQLLYKLVSFGYWGLVILPFLIAAIVEANWKLALLTVSFPSIYIFIWYVFIPQQRKKNFFEDKHYSKPFDITIGTDSFEFTNQYSLIKYKISDFNYWMENEQLIILKVSSNVGHFIPKRLLSSEGDIDRIRNILNEHSVSKNDGSAKYYLLLTAFFLILIIPLLR